MFQKFVFAIAALFIAASLPSANAAQVSPMVVTVTPSGSGSIARLELSNPADVEFPVEVRMFAGEISEAGELELIPADEDFLVFPAQRIVEPNSQQVFRVQFVGEPELAASRVYYAAIRQIPVEFEPGVSQVQVVVNFNVLVNVVPSGVAPRPQAEIVGFETREEVNGANVRVYNAGNGTLMAGATAWELRGNAADGTQSSRRLAPDEASRIFGVGVVAPGKARLFFVPLDPALVPESVELVPLG